MNAQHARHELLGRVWGYAPAVLSRTVEVTVRRLRQKIERDPSKPDRLLTDRGSGYRFRSAPGAALPPEAAVCHNLREPTGALVGRAAPLAALAAEGTGRTYVVGPPGIGKSRLVREHAWRRVCDIEAPGEVWWCDLNDARDISDATRIVADVTGADPALAPDDLGRVLRNRGRLLLVVDHPEGVEDIAPWLRSLCATAPLLSLVVCSRRDPGLVEDVVIRLPPLDPAASLALFSQRVARARGSALEPAEVGDAEAICRALDGLPLALELAAGRSALMEISALHERVAGSLALLIRRGAGWTAREATLEGALRLSACATWRWPTGTRTASRRRRARCSARATPTGTSTSSGDTWRWRRDASKTPCDTSIARWTPSSPTTPPASRSGSGSRKRRCARMGDFDGADAGYAAAAAIARRFGHAFALNMIDANAALVDLDRGNPADAAATLARTRAFWAAGGHEALDRQAQGHLALCDLDLGRTDEAAAGLDASLEGLIGRSMVQLARPLACYRALIAAGRGEGDARERFERALGPIAPACRSAFERAAAAVVRGEWDEEAAQRLVGLERRTLDRVGRRRAQGEVGSG